MKSCSNGGAVSTAKILCIFAYSSFAPQNYYPKTEAAQTSFAFFPPPLRSEGLSILTDAQTLLRYPPKKRLAPLSA
jgi:hypothetical protein